ncbi:MAG: hypothetical protein R2789_16395 [Microthrixaceae bacterium]
MTADRATSTRSRLIREATITSLRTKGVAGLTSCRSPAQPT